MDQDLIFPNDFIEKIYMNRKKNRMLITVAIYSSKEEKIEIDKIIDYDNYEKIANIIELKKLEEARKKVRKNNLYTILYKLHLRSRGMKMIGYFFALYKEDFIKINGFDEKYIGWGEEDDDLSNRFYKMGGELACVVASNPAIHMWHYSAPSKGDSPNIKYYRQRKKEINKNNYKADFGYDNTLGDDKYKVIIIKGEK